MTRFATVAALCVGMTCALAAQGLDGAERHSVTATKSKTRDHADVVRLNSTVVPVPDGYRLPVIYVLDGNSLFPLVGYLTNAFVSFSQQLPAALVVAIGYPRDPSLSRADDIKRQLMTRTHDLSPP